MTGKFIIADAELSSVQEETKKQKDLLQKMLMEVTDESTIDVERVQALLTIETLSAAYAALQNQLDRRN